MLDPELKHYLETLNGNIVKVGQGLPWWRSLLNGVMSGLGSVIGVALALVLFGWFLNIAGIIPAFRREADNWKQLLQQTQQQKLPGLKTQTSPTNK